MTEHKHPFFSVVKALAIVGAFGCIVLIGASYGALQLLKRFCSEIRKGGWWIRGRKA